MSDEWPDRDTKDELKESDAPRRPLTVEEQRIVFRAQFILFILMGFFILAPLLVWWLLNRNH